MIFLLDTHTLIWSIINSEKLSKNAKETISSKNNEICVSIVSFWEISIKTQLKKFSFGNLQVNEIPKYVRSMDFAIIDLNENEAITYSDLPRKENHKDPFDRMLIWQAITRDMTLISKNKYFEQYKKYGLKLLW